MSARASVAALLVGLSVAAPLVGLRAAPLAAQETGAPVPAAVQLDIYLTALAFYTPPRGQVRWIEATPLDAAWDLAPLDSGLLRALTARLGDRFLPGWEDARGQGGRLRLSAIEPAGSGRYRLAVGYRHRTKYFEGPASTQTFLVGCDERDCRILTRGPAAARADW